MVTFWGTNTRISRLKRAFLKKFKLNKIFALMCRAQYVPGRRGQHWGQG
jgi:hypothetical protein